MLNNYFYKFVFVTVFTVFAVSWTNSAEAAILQAWPNRETAAIGDVVEINIKIDSEGVGINAAEAVIQFPQNILQATAISKEGSNFNFWLEEPVFSNGDGRIAFIGGSSSGFSGASLQILKVSFKVIGAGDGEIVFLDGAVTASDGSGTNVLSQMRGTKISIKAGVSTTPGVGPAPSDPSAPVEEPVQITRPAVPTGKLPVMPEIKVPLYPDPNGWSNLISKFSVTWSLPDDVTAVDTLLNKIPSSQPATSEGLFEAREFAPLEDGIWYLHIRFKNNVGWGPTAHYRMAVDTVPPVPFNIEKETDEVSDNPTPFFTFRSGDDLSGLKHYAVRTVGGLVFYTTEQSYQFPPLKPGNYIVVIAAVDNAGNMTESSVDIEILPIASPTITLVSERVVFNDDNIRISGTSMPMQKVSLVLKSERGETISEREAPTDELGNWNSEFPDPVRRGKYQIFARAVDERGAQSLEVSSPVINVVDRPVISILGIDISLGLLFLIFAAMASVVAIVGLMTYRSKALRVARRVIIAQRDVATMANVISANVDKLSNITRQGDVDKEQLRVIVEKTKEDSVRMKKYVVENIGEIKE